MPAPKVVQRVAIVSVAALFFVVIAFVLSQLVLLAGYQLKWIPPEATDMSSMNSGHMLLIVSLQALVFSGLAGVALLLFGKSGLFSSFPLLGGEKIRKREILLGFLGLLAVNLAGSMLLEVLGVEVKQFEDLNRDTLLQCPHCFLLSVVAVAPLYEEFVFRGVLLHSVSRHGARGVVIYAAVFTSLVFAMMHIFDSNELNFTVVIPILFLGLYFSALTLWKKNIRLSIYLHMLQNFIAGIAFLYYPDLPV